ncbi:MAG TPA: Lrp/AsnC family transcriptional regulator [Clostridiales bacterium]|nr:Lrp/AsnC family transcriptional regulator [Clostridiales bacterium]
MNIKLLKLLNQNAKYSVHDLAVMLDMSDEEVKQEIESMEREGLIRGYKAVIDWEKLDGAYVSALIELKVSPQPDAGFEDIAKRIMKFNEVESVYLMSGAFDLCVIVKGKTFQEVAMFVAKQLATMEYVLSTSTHFVLRRYKEQDIELVDSDVDDRRKISLC